MTKQNRIRWSVTTGLALLIGTAQAAVVSWNAGGSDDNWYTSANWDAGIPTTNDIAQVTTGDTITYDGGTNDNLYAMRVIDGTMNVSGGYFEATAYTKWYDCWIGGNKTDDNQVGTVNQSGGEMVLGFVEMARLPTQTGTYNLSGGSLAITYISRKAGYHLFIGSNDGGAGGTGLFEISNDAALTTHYGIYLGWPAGASTNATFSVVGADCSIDIGGYDTNDLAGAWYQCEGNTLKLGIASSGIAPIELKGSSANAYFEFESVIEPYFLDTPETNRWTVLTSEGSITDGGMIFAAGVDTDLWNMGVTNGNTLWISYGMGGWNPDTGVTPPPPSNRQLYWSGAAGTTDTQTGSNWVYNSAPATWGIYNDDILEIGHSSGGMDAGTVASCVYTGGAFSVSQDYLNVGISWEGIFTMQDSELAFRRQATMGKGATANGTVNVAGGQLSLATVRMGLSGGQAAINVTGGDLAITGAAAYQGAPWNSSLAVGYGTSSSSTSTVHVASGSFQTRSGVLLGMNAGVSGSPGVFSVSGSDATQIGIGTQGTTDGFWFQMTGSTLKFSIDEGGVTPIQIADQVAAGGGDGNVYFEAGSILDIAWEAGVTNYAVFDLMTFDGSLTNNGLAFAPSVDADLWSFEFVDANDDGTNDTLRATAYGETSNGTSIPWLSEHGLTEADDEVDNDDDGLLTWEEYIAGTNPTNSASVLTVTSTEAIDSDIIVTWQSVEGKSYSIITNTSLVNPTTGVEASGIMGLPNETSYTGTIGTAASVFYEVEVQ